MAYWVVGGEYTDTRFEILVPGGELECHGPFARYEQAHEIWASRAWATVDDCHTRFRLVDGSETEPGTGQPLIESGGSPA